MFIKETKNSAGQIYYHLVESYWADGKSRQRTLMSLGRAGEDRMDDVITAISKHKDVLTLIDLAKNISIQDTFILGPLLVLERMFEQSGIARVLESIAQKHPKLGFDFKKLIFTMVAARFVRPGSKLKIFEHWQNRFYPEMLVDDIELHQLYRALSILSDHKEDVEMDLFWHKKRCQAPFRKKGTPYFCTAILLLFCCPMSSPDPKFLPEHGFCVTLILC